jgi:hypothetical protein
MLLCIRNWRSQSMRCVLSSSFLAKTHAWYRFKPRYTSTYCGSLSHPNLVSINGRKLGLCTDLCAQAYARVVPFAEASSLVCTVVECTPLLIHLRLPPHRTSSTSTRTSARHMSPTLRKLGMFVTPRGSVCSHHLIFLEPSSSLPDSSIILAVPTPMPRLLVHQERSPSLAYGPSHRSVPASGSRSRTGETVKRLVGHSGLLKLADRLPLALRRPYWTSSDRMLLRL